MQRALVKLAYKHVIDSFSESDFEQGIFNDTYHEFVVQSQSFLEGSNYTTWKEIKTNFPKSDPVLPYKVNFVTARHIKSLNNKIPQLSDTLNLKTIAFINHYFEIIYSDITDKDQHTVAVIYLTDTFTLLDTINDHLLLAFGDKSTELQTQKIENTFFIKMCPELSVYSYQKI